MDWWAQRWSTRYFYPRSPRGERPKTPCGVRLDKGFLSTLPARGATVFGVFGRKKRRISIHAPREGSDGETCAAGSPPANFYPRSPRGERPKTPCGVRLDKGFLSTLPARGATFAGYAYVVGYKISIHAPREGSDFVFCYYYFVFINFYPRSPRGERRGSPAHPCGAALISIHAPREGSDLMRCWMTCCHSDFYPRSPRGERPSVLEMDKSPDSFLSTLPARGATHALFRDIRFAAFLSTLPARGATATKPENMQGFHISIHAPREGSDALGLNFGLCLFQFLSTLPARGATANVLKNKRLPSAAFV